MCDSHKFDHSNKLLVFEYTKLEWQTKNAYRVRMYGGIFWLPKAHTVVVERHGYLTIPLWMAARNGFVKVFNKVKSTEDRKRSIGKWASNIIYEWARIVPELTIDFTRK